MSKRVNEDHGRLGSLRFNSPHLLELPLTNIGLLLLYEEHILKSRSLLGGVIFGWGNVRLEHWVTWTS